MPVRILVLFTGGTIGSTVSGQTINTHHSQNYQLIELFKQHVNDSDTIHFTIRQPLQLLSEQMIPSVWETLIQAIEAEDLAQYEGIIVTHGTDTLSFTAAALGLYFNQLAIPLLLVSSDYPLDNPRANGLNNFSCAVEFIKQRIKKGVFVPYKNVHTPMQVHLATRLASCLQLSADFTSVQSNAFLRFEDGVFYEQHSLDLSNCTPTQLKPHFSTSILLIKPYPGLDYSCFNLQSTTVVLHDLYHSGTACTTRQWGEQYALLQFMQHCQQHGIACYFAPMVQTAIVYESTQQLRELGGQIIVNQSLEVAYVKLLLAYGNYSENKNIERFLALSIAGETI